MPSIPRCATGLQVLLAATDYGIFIYRLWRSKFDASALLCSLDSVSQLIRRPTELLFSLFEVRGVCSSHDLSANFFYKCITNFYENREHRITHHNRHTPQYLIIVNLI
jgi:hypothetical protein